jgi:hypothetical protein
VIVRAGAKGIDFLTNALLSICNDGPALPAGRTFFQEAVKDDSARASTAPRCTSNR